MRAMSRIRTVKSRAFLEKCGENLAREALGTQRKTPASVKLTGAVF
jgi:hypothetical protein